MWLLNAHSRMLEYFQGNVIPPYAILSHRWGDDEVSFQDLTVDSGKTKAAYTKIDECCRLAAEQIDYPALTSPYTTTSSPHQSRSKYPAPGQTLSYVWIDTCCIDKTSSAELSEAINSMYQWYEDAAICYAYLSDVSEHPDDQLSCVTLIARSVWFTRGWTLQELIAPYDLVFLDRRWNRLGTKKELSPDIATRTGIPEAVIQNQRKSSDEPAAAVLSWAAGRCTMREEDRAYSLFGLLGINMPLLYGEGARAFHRLQEVLLNFKDDTTILAWDRIADPSSLPTSIFANSPSDYSELCRRLKPIAEVWGTASVKGAWLSNKGLSLSLYVVPLSYHVYFVPLAYTTRQAKYTKAYGMVIERWDDGLFRRLSAPGNQCLFPSPNFDFDWQYVVLDITIARNSIQDMNSLRLTPSYFHVTVSPSRKQFVHHRTASLPDHHNNITPDRSCCGISDIIGIRQTKQKVTFFLLGLDIRFIPFCLCIATRLDQNAPLDPNEVTIRRRSEPGRNLSLTSQRDMMILVSQFRRNIGGDEERGSNGSIELFSMPMAQSSATLAGKEARFQTSSGISIILWIDSKRMDDLKLDYFVHISLDRAQEEFPACNITGQWVQVKDESISTDRTLSHLPLLLVD